MSHSKILKGASLLSLSEITSQACSLIRNSILAHHLAKADFGIAALLGTLLLLFEMAGKMAFGQQIVQSPKAEEKAYLDSLHFTQLLLNTFSTFLILLLAWPLAKLFAGPQYFQTIAVLALVPFLNGFSNLDIFRQSRQLKFHSQALAEIVPQILTTLAAWPLAKYFQDYRAILCLLIGKSVFNVLASNLLSDRSFTPRYNPIWLRESLKFGWPLLLSGYIQLGNLQGDNMVIAANYNLDLLGEFAAALNIALAPGLALLKVCHSVSLPLLAEVQHDTVQLAKRYGSYVELMALLAALVTIGMIFCGEHLVLLIFGPKYRGVGALASCLTAVQGFRIIRGATVGAAMARGDTVNNLLSNVWRLSGLLLSVLVGLKQCSLTWFALTGVAGEIIALAFATNRLSKKHFIPIRVTLMPTILATAYVLLALSAKWLLPIVPDSFLNWPVMVVAAILCAVIFYQVFPNLRGILSVYVQKVRNKMNPRNAL